MPTHEIESIGIASLARLGGLIGAIYGALFGIPLALISIAADTGFGIVGAIVIILVTTVTVAISIAITGVVYNLLAAAVGGVEVTVQ